MMPQISARQQGAESGRRSVAATLCRACWVEAEPLFAGRGYFAHDVNPLLELVDHIIFDGMNGPAGRDRIVLFDGPAFGHARERVERPIE